MNSGDPLFFRASASCSKLLNVNSIPNHSEKFQGNSIFQDKRKLLKNPECKKYIQYREKYQGKLFSGQAQIVKNPEYKKYIHYSENFQGTLFFQCKRKKKFSIQPIFTWGRSV